MANGLGSCSMWRYLRVTSSRNAQRGCTLRSLSRTVHTMTPDSLVEEQTLPRYDQRQYYPVKPGEILNDKYRIIAKLGYGAYSTVWLAKDTRTDNYAALKICVKVDSISSPILNEIKILQCLQKLAQTDNEEDLMCLQFIRLPDEIFTIDGPAGQHYCIASKPQGSSFREFQVRMPDQRVPMDMLRYVTHRLWCALSWLHEVGGVVHTDMAATNILMRMDDEDTTTFAEIEDAQLKTPTEPLKTEKGFIYESVPRLMHSSMPVLTDFGNARLITAENKDWWQNDLYRAPEILLGLPWSAPADVFSVGVMTLELLEGKNIFDPVDRQCHPPQYVLPIALSQYAGYLGEAPGKMVQESRYRHDFWGENGKWSVEGAPVPQTSLEDFVTVIPPGPEKEMFLEYMRRILTWDPEQRATATELANHEWFLQPYEHEA